MSGNIGAVTIGKVIFRQMEGNTAEHKLVAAMLAQAVIDYRQRLGSPLWKQAQRFLYGKYGRHLCEMCGLEPDFIRELAQRYRQHKLKKALGGC